jgi:excisionase family DNA binding protein
VSAAIDITALAAEIAELIETKPAALLDAKEAAELLHVPATWILAEARHERIPHVRLGRYVRFDTAELIAWKDGRSVGPRPCSG